MPQTLAERHARRPASSGAKRRIVGGEVADVDLFPVSRKILYNEVAFDLCHEQLGQLTQGSDLAAHVEHSAASRGLRPGQ